MEDINEAYGPAEETDIDGKDALIYKSDGKEVVFIIDESRTVEEIILVSF